MEAPRDLESYIHRAGRTARAGKKGKAIMFLPTDSRDQSKRDVERKAGIKFKQIGVPQPESVMEARNEQTRKRISGVREDLLHNFESAADLITEDCQGDCRKALLKSIALMSGFHDKPLFARSLQFGHSGQITYQLDFKD